MAAEKRPASNVFGTSQMVVKRQKSDANLRDRNAVTLANGSGANGALIQSGRTSGLQAPVVELTGHSGEVFASRFDPAGHMIASGSMDRTIMLWRTYGACENFGHLTGHKGAVLDLQWSRDASSLFSASADTTIASWDLESGTRIRRHIGHDEVVNCLDISRRGYALLFSGSDDGSVGVWDARQKAAADYLETEYPITAVAMSEQGHELYTGGIDNAVHAWDMRKKTVVYSMPGHGDTVTSLALSPDGQALLSNSHDGTARSWDVKPFAPADRHMATFDGAPPGLERNLIRASWDPSGARVAAGSGDRSVVVWEARTGKLLYKLPGHKGTVNDVRFSPTGQPIILSCSSDRTSILGELGK